MPAPTPERRDLARTFNSRTTIEEMVHKLSNRATARPFPHLRVVGPTPFTKKQAGAVFTNFTQNPPHVIGFKVSFRQTSEPTTLLKTVTSFSFTIPRKADPNATDAFEDFCVTIETDVMASETHFLVETNLRGTLASRAVHAESPSGNTNLQVYRLTQPDEPPFSTSVPVTRVQQDGQESEAAAEIGLFIEKKVELRDGYYTSEVKIKNLSTPEKVVHFLLGDDHTQPDSDEEEDESGTFRRESDYILTGYLLEFELVETIVGGELVAAEGRDTAALRTFNVVPLDCDRHRISFSDYFIGEERIFPMRQSATALPQFAETLRGKGLRLDDLLCVTVQAVLGKTSLEDTRLWVFQEEAVERILTELKERNGITPIISVRTAGGKTEGFLIPLLQHCLDHLSAHGVKAIIFYPTKALANDQAKRLFRMLYFCNAMLGEQGQRPITMALYHGDIETEMTGEVEWVPFKCQRGCDIHLELIRQDDKNYLRCPRCNHLYDYCFVTRGDSHIWLPDILISNPDTLTHAMTWRAERHSILGRHVKGCLKCGWTTPLLTGRRCQGLNGECKSSLVTISPEQVPDIFIYDEVHLFNGSLGMNVAAFNARLRMMLGVYSAKFCNRDDYAPVYIGSSATIKNPEHFASIFFGVEPRKIRPLPSDPSTAIDDSKSSHTRYNLFLLPRAYRPKQTTSLLTKYLLEFSHEVGPGFSPRILAFVNSLRDCNDLIIETKSRVNTELFKIDGHNTQYTREQRSDREVSFNKGELHVLYATSTLEVGIDFEDVDVLIIFSPPYLFNDYLQRIGRAGRKTDALVITVCKSSQAIDYWYFEHAGDVVDRPHQWAHRIPIGENNPEIVKKGLRLALLDALYVRNDITDIVKRDGILRLLDKQRGAWQPNIEADISSYLRSTFGSHYEESTTFIMREMAKGIIGFQGDFGQSLLEAVHKRLNEEQGLDNLRSSERSVTVQYTFGMPFSR